MANQKAKTECYANLGGINSKFSPYVLTNVEFENIINFDFQTPGALTQRWGSTQYIGQTFPGSINALFEFSRLDGTSMLIVGATGGIWYGATQGTLQGMSFTVLGQTQIAGIMSFAGAGVILSPGPAFTVNETPFPVVDPLNQYILATGATVYIDPVLLKDDTLSISVENNFMFMADTNKFLKFDGSTSTIVSLPPVSRVQQAGVASGFSLFYSNNGALPSWPAFGSSGLINGAFYCYMTYVNNRGFEGPLTPMAVIQTNGFGSVTGGLGGSFAHYAIQVATPLQYGISAINQYVYFIDGSSLGLGILIPSTLGGVVSYGATISPLIFDPVYLSTIPASGSTFTWIPTGTTNLSIGTSFSPVISNLGTFFEQNNQIPIGGTFQLIPTFGGYKIQSEYDLTNYSPRFLSDYQNRLFSAGFSTTPSTVWFSDPTEPEGYEADSNIEVRTNDADVISCLASYFTRLYIFKRNSFHVLTGDNPNNFVLQELSDNYGCLNDRCALVFENTMFFLDRKGIMEFNGAQLQNTSLKVQTYFDRMNYNVALTTAIMSHDKLRNQILIGIPIDNATSNNITLVFDYVASAWTSYEGFNPSVFANIQGVNNTKFPFYGDTSGRVNQFSPTLIFDNGVGMSLYFQTNMHHDLGESIEKQYRRLYINKNVGETMAFAINYYQDFGASQVLSATYVVGTFQERFDFGIPAAAIAFELNAFPLVQPLQIFGYTFEQRLQRMVSR